MYYFHSKRMQKCYLVIVTFITLSFTVSAQESPSNSTFYTCANKGYDFLAQVLGHWKVQTKDRTSPGIYEENMGNSIVEPTIEGCGVSIRYQGIYRNKPYAFDLALVAKDSANVQMVRLDSEHGSYSISEGTISNNMMEVYWYRNKEIGKLISKHVMTIQSLDVFEFSSFLSTDYGKSWALTHERKYMR